MASCNICRSSQSTQVNTGNLLSTNDFAVNASKTPGNSTKIDLENKALPLSVYSGGDDTTKSPSAKGRIGAGKAPPRGSSIPESTFMQQNAAVDNVTTELENRKPKQKKSRKKSVNTEEDIQLVYKNQIASLSTAVPETSSMTVPTLRSQPTVEEESDLLENAEQERRRNKERVRAKNMFENKHLSPVKVMDKLDIAYLNAQREIDKILEPQSLKLQGLHRDKLMKGKDNVEIHKYNEVNKDGNKDSLENARLNIHKLLDEAFGVLSERKTIMINKQQPSREMSSEANSFNSQKNHFTITEQIVQTDESMLSHKVHTPIQVHHSFASNDPEGLITWNPYRAYDDTKLISSINHETNRSATPVQQEHVKTSNFEQPFSLQSKYYVTEPGEPIIIRTRNLHDVIPKNSTPRKMSTTTLGVSENLLSHTKSRNLDALQNPVFKSSVPDTIVDMYPNNFYELSCFQETPTTSRLMKAATPSSTQPDSSSSPYQDSNRTISANKLYTEGHSEPHKSIDKNYDVVDIIKTSLQPGISPQPLIDSLRKELQILSSKAQAASKKDH